MTVKNFSLILLALSFFGCQKNDGYKINVSVTDSQSGMLYLLTAIDRKPVPVDSVILKDGKGTFFGKVDNSEIFLLKFENSQETTPLFIENSEINIVLQSDDIKNAKISGSKSQNLYEDFLKQLAPFDSERQLLREQYKVHFQSNDIEEVRKIETEIDNIDKKRTEMAQSFVENNRNSIVSLFLIRRFLIFTADYQELSEILAQTPQELRQNSIYRFFAQRLQLMESLLPGKQISDYSFQNTEGEMVNISDFRGKYLLLDFWASWCPDCRKVNPQNALLYNKYKPKGFEILGISLDNDRQKWIEAIEKDKLTWTQVSELKRWDTDAVKLFGIMAIPTIILIDDKGIIVAYNPSHERLEEILEEIF